MKVNKRSRTWRGLRAALALAGCVAGALVVAAAPPEAAAQARDRWGLTDQDWLSMAGPQLRAAAGFPGSFSQVLAAAQAGDAKAAALVAGAYAVGAGTAANPAEAHRWARAASAADLPMGHFALAMNYREGTGVAKDLRRYVELLRKAAEAGHRGASLEYASVIPSAEIRDVAPTWIDRKRHYQIAADAGNAMARDALGILEINARLSETLSGKPMWKDSRGLVVGHVDYVGPEHPCVTVVRTTQGQAWTITWVNVRAWRPQATSLVIDGDVAVGNAYANSAFNTGLVPITRELGFVLLENNRSHSPEETRRQFASMEQDMNTLVARCRSFLRLG